MGKEMKICIKFIAYCLVGIFIWVAVGITLEHFVDKSAYFMLAGYLLYPLFDYINKAIMK